MPDFAAAAAALTKLARHADYLYEDAATLLFHHHEADGHVTLLGAFTGNGAQASARDIGTLWTQMSRADLVAAYEDYLMATYTEVPIGGNQSLTLMG